MEFRTIPGLIIAAIILSSGSAVAQNRYFADDENGVSLQVGYVSAEDGGGFGGVAALTLLGRIDLSFAYVSPQKKTEVGYIYKWKEFTPRLGVALLRPYDTRLFGVDLAVSYTKVRFDGYMRDRVGGDVIAGGFDFYVKLRESRNLTFLPTLGVAYARANSWRSADYDVEAQDNTVESVMVGGELSFFINQKYFIAPSITYFDSNTALALMIGMAFPQEW